MKFILFFAFVTCALAHTIERSFYEEKVVGGTVANPGQFPYQVSLKYNGKHICGGSIIDQNTILTAAHCVDKLEGTKLNIVAGTNKLNESGVQYSVSRYIIHENYNLKKIANNIAVIKLTTQIEFTEYVQSIPIDDRVISDDVECVVSGWGNTGCAGTSTNDLLYFKGRVLNFNKCKQIYSRWVSESNICTFARYGVGVCLADSGGPLVSNNKQIGIVSWTLRCGKGYPDVFTRVSYYSDWIKKQQAEIN